MKAHERPTSKQCSKCGQTKPVTEFYGTKWQCKVCRLAICAEYRGGKKPEIQRYLRNWYKENRERVLERCHEYNAKPEVKERERIRQAARYAANKDAIRASRRAYYERNEEARKRFTEYQQAYAKRNKSKLNERTGKRRSARKNALPKWADRKAIARFYVIAEQKTRETGIKHVVDHIIPLQGRNVCGLHVENNLQVLTQKENLEKFNKFG